MNTAQILRAAAARVRQGWMQGDYGYLINEGFFAETYGQRTCAIGALCAVANVPPGEIGAFEAFDPSIVILRKVIGGLKVHAWNDAPEQTAEGVATGLEFAALCYEEEEKQHTAAPSAAESLVPCNRL